jgi:hypothetical protein
MNDINRLPVLLAALKAAKVAENEAKEIRTGLETAILDLCPPVEAGEGIAKLEGFSITYKMTRAVDTEALQDAWGSLPANAQKAFKWKAEIDLKNYRAIQEMDQTAFTTLAKFVTSKPAKPTITIKD